MPCCSIRRRTVETTKPYAEQMKQQMSAIPADQYAGMQAMIAAQLVKNPEGQKLVAASSGASDRAGGGGGNGGRIC